jgi:hypothetical protein
MGAVRDVQEGTIRQYTASDVLCAKHNIHVR